MVMFTLPIIDQKYPFGANLVQNINGFWPNSNMVFDGDPHFFCLRPVSLFVDKFVSKFQKCLFKFNFGLKTNSNMQNLNVMFTFSFLD